MRYFLDTEFDQTVDPVELISIGIVAEDGRELYAVSRYFEGTTDKWLLENVIPNLYAHLAEPGDPLRGYDKAPDPLSLVEIRGSIETFLSKDDKIEFWGYYADYDWYLFTRLWGFLSMPKGFPMLCYDVKQYAMHLGIPSVTKLVPEFQPEHHALIDARWTKRAFEYLKNGK